MSRSASKHLTLYSDGQPIAHSRVSTGVPGHATPTGVFSVIQKDRWHRSNIYNNAPMYYMQRITWSGVAMHQGVVPSGPASHGCIRLPEAFARQMWGITKLGARVIVTRGDVTPVGDFQRPPVRVQARHRSSRRTTPNRKLSADKIKAAYGILERPSYRPDDAINVRRLKSPWETEPGDQRARRHGLAIGAPRQ